jgi:hypothetical protein
MESAARHGEEPVRSSRASGIMVIELYMALAVLAVGILSAFALFHCISFSSRSAAEVDDVRTALDQVVELLRRAPFEEMYARYQGAEIEVPNLFEEDGRPARVKVRFYVDELEMPPEFGPVVDINGIGRLETPDCSVNYRILPARLTLTYRGFREKVSQELFLVLEPGLDPPIPGEAGEPSRSPGGHGALRPRPPGGGR